MWARKLFTFEYFMAVYKILFGGLVLISSGMTVYFVLRGGCREALDMFKSLIIFSFFLWFGVNIRKLQS